MTINCKKLENFIIAIYYLIIIMFSNVAIAKQYNVNYYCKDSDIIEEKECLNCFTYQDGKEIYVDTICN